MMCKTARFATLLVVIALLFCQAVPAGASFESEYKSYTGEWAGGGLSPIKMKLEEDTLTLDYSPVFYFDPGFKLTESDKARIITECVVGFKQWEGIYEIDGCELTVMIDVHPTTIGSKLGSSVRVLPLSPVFTSMVPGAFFWKPDSPLLTIELRCGSPQDMYFERVAMHEFGHVLGLFDAYGYGEHMRRIIPGIDLRWLGDWLFPEAPPDRAQWNSVMYAGWEISPTEAEMLLWAWKNGRLQLYTKNVLTWLGAEVSPAFSE